MYWKEDKILSFLTKFHDIWGLGFWDNKKSRFAKARKILEFWTTFRKIRGHPTWSSQEMESIMKYYHENQIFRLELLKKAQKYRQVCFVAQPNIQDFGEIQL